MALGLSALRWLQQRLGLAGPSSGRGWPGRLLGSAVLALGVGLGLGLALLAGPDVALAGAFVDCDGACAEATYYVGYGRGNRVGFGGSVAALPPQPLVVYPQVADVQTQEPGPNVDEQRLAVGRDGAQPGQGAAIATHRIDAVRIGYLQKSETLALPALPLETDQALAPAQDQGTATRPAQNASASGLARATSDLRWGDTLRISSKRLALGSPVALQIERQMGGAFVQPATDYVNYRVKSNTWVKGRRVPQLDYELARFAGPGEGDREQGQALAAASVLVKVGDAVTLEGRLQVEDGLVASATPQLLDGIDSVSYRVDLLSDDSCARSDSGVLTVGDCD